MRLNQRRKLYRLVRRHAAGGRRSPSCTLAEPAEPNAKRRTGESTPMSQQELISHCTADSTPTRTFGSFSDLDNTVICSHVIGRFDHSRLLSVRVFRGLPYNPCPRISSRDAQSLLTRCRRPARARFRRSCMCPTARMRTLANLFTLLDRRHRIPEPGAFYVMRLVPISKTPSSCLRSLPWRPHWRGSSSSAQSRNGLRYHADRYSSRRSTPTTSSSP